MRTDLPIISALNPDLAVASPPPFVRFDSPIRGGLPHVIPLLPRWRAVLSMPTGSARAWLDMPSATPINDGAPRLRFQFDKSTVFIAPLVRGDVYEVEFEGAAPLKAIILDWSIHAGDMVGPGDRGSYLSLAVAAADKADSEFGPIPPSDFIIAALPVPDRMETRPGRTIPLRYQRLKNARLLRSKVHIL